MAKLKLPKSLESLRTELDANVRPCVALRAAQKPSKDATATRFGGAPLVPKGTKWPKRTRPLTFVGQLNFSQLARVEASLGLPRMASSLSSTT